MGPDTPSIRSRGVHLGTYGDYMVTPTLTETVARNVVQAMHLNGENPNSLARGARIPRVTLLRRLDGTTPFKVDELGRIARHLNTTADQFFTVSDLAA